MRPNHLLTCIVTLVVLITTKSLVYGFIIFLLGVLWISLSGILKRSKVRKFINESPIIKENVVEYRKFKEGYLLSTSSGRIMYAEEFHLLDAVETTSFVLFKDTSEFAHTGRVPLYSSVSLVLNIHSKEVVSVATS